MYSHTSITLVVLIGDCQTDVVEKVENVLKELGVYGDTFSEIGEHSPVAGIDAGIDAIDKAKADFIVSVGGGSPVDASKVMAYRLHERSGNEAAPCIRQIAIPTTLSVAETTVRQLCLSHFLGPSDLSRALEGTPMRKRRRSGS